MPKPKPKTRTKTRTSKTAQPKTPRAPVIDQVFDTLSLITHLAKSSGCAIRVGLLSVHPAPAPAPDEHRACVICAGLRGHILGLCEGLNIPVTTADRARLDYPSHPWLETVLYFVREEGQFPPPPEQGAGADVPSMDSRWEMPPLPEEAAEGDAVCPNRVQVADQQLPCCLKEHHQGRCCANLGTLNVSKLEPN